MYLRRNIMNQGENILQNKTRKMIYNLIITYPGVSYNILKNIFELTDGVLRYHLNYLKKAGMINFGFEKRLRCYYPDYNTVNGPRKSMNSLEMQKLTPKQELLLGIIKQYPGINQKELIKRSRLNQIQVSKNLKKLSNLNLIKRTQKSRTICYNYVPDEELKFEIMKRLLIKLLKDEIDDQTFLKLKRKLE